MLGLMLCLNLDMVVAPSSDIIVDYFIPFSDFSCTMLTTISCSIDFGTSYIYNKIRLKQVWILPLTISILL